MIGRLLLIGLLAGCAGSDATSSKDTSDSTSESGCQGEAAVEVGTGQVAFEPLSSGQSLPFYLGPQGGYHVFVSVRGTGIYGGEDALDPNNPVLSFRMDSGAETLAELSDLPRQLVPQGDDVQLVGQLLIFSVPDPPAWDGEPATIIWSLTDRCDRVFEGEVDVELVYDADQTG